MASTYHKVCFGVNDQEYCYRCDCGFYEYISTTCNCEECSTITKGKPWPFKVCPDCSKTFVPEHPKDEVEAEEQRQNQQKGS